MDQTEQTMLEKIAAFVKEPADKILKYRFEEKCLIVVFVDGRKVFYALDQPVFAENKNYSVIANGRILPAEAKQPPQDVVIASEAKQSPQDVVIASEAKQSPTTAKDVAQPKKGRPKKQ